MLLQEEKQADRMHFLPPDVDISALRSAVANLEWLCHTWPDASCLVAQLGQCSTTLFNGEYVRHLITTIRAVRANPKLVILHRKAGSHSLQLVVYADGAFANDP